jgi:hypothetical protein
MKRATRLSTIAWWAVVSVGVVLIARSWVGSGSSPSGATLAPTTASTPTTTFRCPQGKVMVSASGVGSAGLVNCLTPEEALAGETTTTTQPPAVPPYDTTPSPTAYSSPALQPPRTYTSPTLAAPPPDAGPQPYVPWPLCGGVVCPIPYAPAP